MMTCVHDSRTARGTAAAVGRRASRPPARRRRIALAVSALLLPAACGDGATVEPPPSAPTWILLVPDSLRFTYLGERVRAQVRVQRVPELVGGREVRWSSTDTAVFTVDVEGEVTARANGEAALVAEVMGLRDTARVRVRQEAARIEVLAGEGQRGPAGLELLDPVHVRMTDAGGTLLAVEAFVDYDASAHGGRVSRKVGNPTTYEKWARWTLGPAPGPQSLAVTVLHGPATAEIGAVALHPDSVAAVAFVHSGEGQGALPGEALAEPVVVAVVDTLGRRLPGATVRFEPAAGHGSADPAEAATDTLGLAATVWTLGEATGRQTLIASAGAGASVEVGAVALSDEGVCARTPEVAEEIARLAGVAGCAEVTGAHLEEFRTRPSKPIMRLERRGIRRLRSGDFAGLSLGLLDLSHNELTELPPGLFDGLAVSVLGLEFNRLDGVAPRNLRGPGQLANSRIWTTTIWPRCRRGSLTARRASETLLPSQQPAGGTAGGRIRGLDRHQGTLAAPTTAWQELPEGRIRWTCRAGRHLRLNGNRLARLAPDVFAGLTRLHWLDLNDNNLRALPPGVFDGLTGLGRLNLSSAGRMYALPPEDLRRSGEFEDPGLGVPRPHRTAAGRVRQVWRTSSPCSLRLNHLARATAGGVRPARKAAGAEPAGATNSRSCRAASSRGCGAWRVS